MRSKASDPSETTPDDRCRTVRGTQFECSLLPQLRGAASEAAKVTNGKPTVRSHVQHRRTTRLPTGREPYGNGASVVVVGVTTDQGVRESRTQGEVRQVFSTTKTGRYVRCVTPQLC